MHGAAPETFIGHGERADFLLEAKDRRFDLPARTMPCQAEKAPACPDIETPGLNGVRVQHIGPAFNVQFF